MEIRPALFPELTVREYDLIQLARKLAWTKAAESREPFTEMEDSKAAFGFGFEAGFAFCELRQISEGIHD